MTSMGVTTATASVTPAARPAGIYLSAYGFVLLDKLKSYEIDKKSRTNWSRRIGELSTNPKM
jgi:hypothetical protein